MSESDFNKIQMVSTPIENHTCLAPVKVLIDNNVDVLLINGIGGRPMEFCLQNGIKVYIGSLGIVLNILRNFLGGFLNQAFQGTYMGQN